MNFTTKLSLSRSVVKSANIPPDGPDSARVAMILEAAYDEFKAAGPAATTIPERRARYNVTLTEQQSDKKLELLGAHGHAKISDILEALWDRAVARRPELLRPDLRRRGDE